MSVILNPGFSASISIKNNETEIFEKKFGSKKEVEFFLQIYGKSAPQYPIWQAIFVPARTDNWRDLTKDLLLPTFINHAFKIDHFVLKIFASIGAVVLDVLTIIPRLITSPFRAFYNYKTENTHPLISFIKTELPFTQLTHSNILKIDVNLEKIATHWISCSTGDLNTATKTITSGHCYVAVKSIPGSTLKPRIVDQVINYMEVNKEWQKQQVSEQRVSTSLKF